MAALSTTFEPALLKRVKLSGQIGLSGLSGSTRNTSVGGSFRTQRGLTDPLTTWFGPPRAAMTDP